MSDARRMAARIVMILGILLFFLLLVLARDTWMEWVGLVLMLLGGALGHQRQECTNCHRIFVGLAVKPPPYCAGCGNKLPEERPDQQE